jgi:hypothetical protein
VEATVKRALMMMLGAAVALGAAACGDSPAAPSSSATPPSSAPPASSGNGRLLVRLHAEPYAQAKAVLVTFSRVRIYRGSPTNFTDTTFASGSGQITCDLNKLAGDAEIVTSIVPAAAYSQIGLVIQSATAYIDNPTASTACAASIAAPGGRASALAVPAGEIAVPRNFDTKAGADTIMRLNFNSDQSIRVTGENSFSFTPVFSVLSVSTGD